MHNDTADTVIDRKTVLTPQNAPNHDTVGYVFTFCGHLYFCDSYDPRLGYWMTNVLDEGDRRNVSERAIGRTYHALRMPQIKVSDDYATYWAVHVREPMTWEHPQKVMLDDSKVHDWHQVLFFDEFDAMRFGRKLAEAAALPPMKRQVITQGK